MNEHQEETYKTDKDMSDILSDFSQFYILLLLSELPSHGYALIKKFKERTGKNLSAGTLYPFLQKLERMGITTQKDESVGKKPKTVYSLTRKGKTFCNRLFQRFATMTASAIEPSLKTCASCGVKLYDNAHYEDVDGTRMAFCCSHCAAAFKSRSVK